MLQKAVGESELVIAAVVDIRGFSSFAMKVESVQTSAFLKRVYMKIIDGYLKGASFFKPTGDGLLAVFPWTEDDLEEMASKVIGSFVTLIEEFPNLCKGDAVINFDVPTELGIGLSRGVATKLVSGGSILDYSGRPLNIASRLMNLARPSGIVLDEAYGFFFIPEAHRSKFATDEIYIRGISTEKPTKIFYTKDLTRILPSARVVYGDKSVSDAESGS